MVTPEAESTPMTMEPMERISSAQCAIDFGLSSEGRLHIPADSQKAILTDATNEYADPKQRTATGVAQKPGQRVGRRSYSARDRSDIDQEFSEQMRRRSNSRKDKRREHDFVSTP